MGSFEKRYRKVHLDFHTPESAPQAVEMFDPEEFISILKRADVNIAVIFTKCHYGNAYYETSVSHKHSGLEVDFLGEVIREAHANDISVIAYHSVAWDNRVPVYHPDWEVVRPEMKSYTGVGWRWCCLNSPYRDYVLSMLREISENYEIDGLWLDWAYIEHPWLFCYCHRCRRKFRETYGYDMIRFDDAPLEIRRMMVEFNANIKDDFISAVSSVLKESRSDGVLTYNQAGHHLHPYPENLDNVGFLAVEAHAPNYLFQSFIASYLSCQHKPAEVITPRFLKDWGEWTLKPVETLKTEVASIISSGGLPSIGDQIYPSGKLEVEFYNRLREVFSWLEEREEWLLGSESVKDVAVLNSTTTNRVREILLEEEMDASSRGAHRAFVDGKVICDIINEKALDVLPEYNVLVLPDQICISEDCQEKIKDYVRNGGGIVATGRTTLFTESGEPRENFGLADLFGASYEGDFPFSRCFIEVTDETARLDLPKIPILSRERPVRLNLTSGTNLGLIVEPSAERIERTPAPARRTDLPSIVMNIYGKGKCIYVASPIERDIRDRNEPWLKELYLKLTDMVRRDTLTEVRAPLSVRVSLRKQPGRWIFHFVNVVPNPGELGPSYVEDLLPARGIKVKVKVPSEPKSVYSAPDRWSISASLEGEWLSFEIPEVKIHSMTVIEFKS